MTNPDLASLGLLVVVCWLSLMGLVVASVVAAVTYRFWWRLRAMDQTLDRIHLDVSAVRHEVQSK